MLRGFLAGRFVARSFLARRLVARLGLERHGCRSRLVAMGFLVVLFLLPHPQAFLALLLAQAVRIVLHQEGGRLARTLLAA